MKRSKPLSVDVGTLGVKTYITSSFFLFTFQFFYWNFMYVPCDGFSKEKSPNIYLLLIPNKVQSLRTSE